MDPVAQIEGDKYVPIDNKSKRRIVMKVDSKRFSILLAGLFVLAAAVACRPQWQKTWFTPSAES